MSDQIDRALNFEGNPPSPSPARKNHLLVIGIDQYQYVGKLSNAVRDAQAIRDLLLSRYHFEKEQLKEIYNGQATRRNLMKSLRSYLDRLTDKDNLLVYFSGHGHYDKKIEEAYWVPVDAEYEEVDDYVSYSYL